MRHSSRMDIGNGDNGLSTIDELANENMPYKKNGTSYDPPIFNFDLIPDEVLQILGRNKTIDTVRLNANGTRKIKESFQNLQTFQRDQGVKFNCIVSSPFKRCIQTSIILAIMNDIPLENILINYSIREPDRVLVRYQDSSGKDFDKSEPYDKLYIDKFKVLQTTASQLNYQGIINEIVQKALSLNLGNVIIVTHGDIFGDFYSNAGIPLGIADVAGFGIFKFDGGSVDKNMIHYHGIKSI